MADSNVTGGNLFDIPPLDDFCFDPGSSSNSANQFTSSMTDNCGSAPFTTFEAFTSSPPPLDDIPSLDAFENFPSLGKNGHSYGTETQQQVTATVLDNTKCEFGSFTASNETKNISELHHNHPSEDVTDGFTSFADFTCNSEIPVKTCGNTAATSGGPPPLPDDDFGDFSSGNTAVTSGGPPPIRDDDFGDFSSGNTAATSGGPPPIPDDDFGDFSSGNTAATSGGPPPICDDDFGDFSSGNTAVTSGGPPPLPDDDFGNFSSGNTAVTSGGPPPLPDDDFGNFSSGNTAATSGGPPPIRDDDFGDFSSGNSAVPKDDFGEFDSFSSAKKQCDPTSEFKKDDGFADFGAFESVSNANTQKNKGEEFASFDSAQTNIKDEWEFTAAPKTGNAVQSPSNVKVAVDVLVACFPLNGDPSTNQDSSKQLMDLLVSKDESLSDLQKKTGSTGSLYQWKDSLLQDRFYKSLQVDPMLVPSGASGVSGSDPFALSSLMDEFGIPAGGQTIPGEFGWPKTDSEGSGATLLDLSLPLSPSEKNNKDAESVLVGEDLKGLDLTGAAKATVTPTETTAEDMTTSWMDSELMELEKETAHLPVSAPTNLEWLNNPELTTMVKPGDFDLLNSKSGSLGMGLDLLPTDPPALSDDGEMDILSNGSNGTSEGGGLDLLPPSPRLGSENSQSVDLLTTVPGTSNEGTGSDPTPSSLASSIQVSSPQQVDLLYSSSGPTTVSSDPTVLAPSPPLENVDEQTSIATQGLTAVMELTSKVTGIPTQSLVTSSQPPPISSDPTIRTSSLSPPRSSIDIMEDELFKMSSGPKKKEHISNGELSQEARALLDKLPDLSFMARKH